MHSDTKNQLISMWGIEDALLQSYRNIFITSESVLLAISATILTTNAPFVAIVLAIIGYIVLHIWKSVCSARAKDVSFLQWLLLKIERENEEVDKPIDVFKFWQDTKKYGTIEVLQDSLFKEVIFESVTRQKMEKTLPRTFFWMWVVVITYSIVATFVIHKGDILNAVCKVLCKS